MMNQGRGHHALMPAGKYPITNSNNASMFLGIHHGPSSRDTIVIATDDRDQKYTPRDMQGGSLDNRASQAPQSFVIQTAVQNV